MASRADQLHSHQFTRQRVVAALAQRDPDAVGGPARRSGAVFASVMLAALALAAVGVYAVVRPAPDPSWRDGHAVIIEQETGARFVLRDGVLHPVLNQASALLVLGGAAGAPIVVAGADLAGLARGATWGIAGAPDPLPAASALDRGAWQVCSRPAVGGGAGSVSASASASAESVLLVGVAAAARPLGDRAVLAVDPVGALHVLWRGRQYPVREPEIVLTAFGWRASNPVPVAAALINAAAAGTELGAVDLGVTDVGGDSIVAGYPVGQVLVVRSEAGATQFAVALAAGVATITQVQADLLLAAGTSAAPVELDLGAYAQLPPAASLVPTGADAPPSTTPALDGLGPADALCESFMDGTSVDGAPAGFGVVAGGLGPAGELATAAASEQAAGGAGVVGSALATWVRVPPGHGALVRAEPGGALGLVTDLGVRYPVPSASVLTALGLAGAQPVRLPSAVVALLPTGPALDPAAVGVPS